MAQFWIYVKTEILTQMKQAPTLLGMYVLLPLFFSFFMGFSFDTAFAPDASIDPIQISLVNSDEGDVGQVLVDTLATDEMSEFIEIVEPEESDFHMQIQPNYSQNITDTLVTIEASDGSSTSEEVMLKNLIISFQQALVDQETLAGEIGTIEDPQVAENLLTSLEQAAQVNTDTMFETQTYESDTALTGNQFTAVGGLIYMLFMSLASGVNFNSRKELKGFRKRFGVTPITPAKKVLFEIVSGAAIFGILGTLYMVVWRLIDSAVFSGNPLFYLLWLLVYIIFFQAVNAMLMYITPEKLGNIIFQILLMVFMIFGFLPIDKMIGGEVGELLSQNIFRRIFNQPFFDYMLSGNFSENIGIAVGLILVTIVIVAITIAIKKRKELRRP